MLMAECKMLPKERVVAALEFTTPDRIPIGETGIDYTITQTALGHSTLYRAKWKEYQALWQGQRDEYVESCKRDVIALAHKFEHDFVPVFLVPSRYKKLPEPEFISEYKWRLPDGRIYEFSPVTEGHAFLCDSPQVTLDQLTDIADDIDESELELVEHVVKELGDTHFIVGRIGAGIFPADKYRFDFLLMGMLDQPELIHRIIEIETAYTIAAGEAMLDAGCDAIMDLSDVAGNRGSYMSPRMFREFIFPALKAQCDVARARGKYYIKHTDGNTWGILDMMIEAGIDGWHGIQPSIGMTLPKLQERYRGQLCFFGGVDVSTLVAGTEEEVAEEVRMAVESAPAEGGLVLTSGNTLMVGTRYENYLAMLVAARSYWR
jgi:hypothetical protein